TTKRGEIVSFLEPNGLEGALSEFLEEACLELADADADEGPALGYGELTRDVAGLRKSLIEAQHACLVASSRPGQRCPSHAEVGSHLLLVALQDQDVLGHFHHAILEPLEEHDARSQVSLIDTLDAFLTSGGRWRETAKDLYIHVNTLRHRLQKVEELTDRDLS